jgi:hypothetical protein
MYVEDWEKTEKDDAEYMAAECEEPHEDGSACLPSWDGYGYVCTYRIVADAMK